jgi:Ca2+-binding EF-hand superfamily protein
LNEYLNLFTKWSWCRCADGENATLTEFEQVLKAMKMDSLIPLAPRVFDLFDNNRDGTVDMREILCGLSNLRNSRGDDALRLCFQVYTQNHTLLEKDLMLQIAVAIQCIISMFAFRLVPKLTR